jgi:hypothetical protein
MITSAWASIPRCLRRCMRRSIAAVPVRAGHAISQAPITITCCWSANWPICKPPASQALRGHAGSNQFCRMLFCLCGQHGAQSRACSRFGRGRPTRQLRVFRMVQCGGLSLPRFDFADGLQGRVPRPGFRASGRARARSCAWLYASAAAASGRKPAGRVGRPGQIDAGSLVTRTGTDRVDAGDCCDPAWAICRTVATFPDAAARARAEFRA